MYGELIKAIKQTFIQTSLLSRCEAGHVVEGQGVVGPYLIVIGLVIECKWEHSLDIDRRHFSSLPLKVQLVH